MKKLYVVGGANLDIVAQSDEALISHDSNPGKVHYSVGGVSHNVAVNLARIGCNVSYITAFSTDSFGQRIKEDCINSNLDITHCQDIDDCSTSLYIAICDNDGDMNVAIADMELLNHLDVDKVVKVLENTDEDDLIVLDTNLNDDQLDRMTAAAKGKIYVDPISTTKARKIKPYLNRIEMLKPNLLEAQEITGIHSEGFNGYVDLLDYFINNGVKSIVISMGSDGVIARKGEECYHISAMNVEVVNTTGAGDAFMAGYIYGELHDCSFLDSLRFAISNSCIALMSADSANQFNSENLLKEMYSRAVKETVVTCIKR